MHCKATAARVAVVKILRAAEINARMKTSCQSCCFGKTYTRNAAVASQYRFTFLSRKNPNMKEARKVNVSFPKLVAIAMCAVAVIRPSWQAAAQSPPEQTATTWQDLGLNLPGDFPTSEISLFEGLNKARGSWSFSGERVDGEVSAPVLGSLHVTGSPQSGMFPMWRMIWSWPAEDSELAIMYIIAAGPRKDGFDLMLTRIGPVKNLASNKPQPGVLPVIFKGTWNADKRTLSWVEGGAPPGLPGRSADDAASQPQQSFELVVAADGKVAIQNSKHVPPGQMVTAKATDRTGEAPAEPRVLAGKHEFATTNEIADPRIQPWLPPQATDITLFSESGGHFARYKVAPEDFMAFVDKLWEDQKDASAHQRDSMSGEGEPAQQERMVRRFKTLGWDPLENAVMYYSPSKSNGAMTTYYYDRAAEIAYHDRGYW